MTSATIRDDALTGNDIYESSLGPVPTAQDAQHLGGLGANEFVQGGGRLWGSEDNVLQWITPADGVSQGVLLSDITPGPDDGLLVGMYCSNNTADGTGANIVLANWGPGPIDVMIDAGDGNSRIVRVEDGYGAYSNRLVTDHILNETRRVVFQGVRSNGEAFFVSVIVQQQSTSCRAASIAYSTS